MINSLRITLGNCHAKLSQGWSHRLRYNLPFLTFQDKIVILFPFFQQHSINQLFHSLYSTQYVNIFVLKERYILFSVTQYHRICFSTFFALAVAKSPLLPYIGEQIFNMSWTNFHCSDQIKVWWAFCVNSQNGLLSNKICFVFYHFNGFKFSNSYQSTQSQKELVRSIGGSSPIAARRVRRKCK